MKLKKISIATVLLILVGFAFTSCEEDKWESAILDYNSYDLEPPLRSDRNGYLQPFDQLLNMRDIKTSDYGNIQDIRVFDSYFILKSRFFRPGFRMEIRLESNTNRRYIGQMIPKGNDQYVVDMNDRNYAAFVDDLMYDLERQGTVTMTISGKSAQMQEFYYDFEFNNNLDLRIRR